MPTINAARNCCELIAAAVEEAKGSHHKELDDKDTLQLLHAPHTLDGVHWSYINGLMLRATFQSVRMSYRRCAEVAGPTSSLPSHTYASSTTFYAGKQRLSSDAYPASTQVTHVEVQWRPQQYRVQELDLGRVKELLTSPRIQQHLKLLDPPKDFPLWRGDSEMLTWDGMREYHLCLKADCKLCSV